MGCVRMGWGQLGQVRLGGGGLDKSTRSCKPVECGEGMELCSGIGLVGISATDWFGGVGQMVLEFLEWDQEIFVEKWDSRLDCMRWMEQWFSW